MNSIVTVSPNATPACLAICLLVCTGTAETGSFAACVALLQQV